MKEHYISMVVVLVFVLMSCLLVGSQPMQPSTTTFVSYLFVLQWPPGVCASTIRCKKNPPTDLTIHGLWPQDRNNRGVPPYTSSPCSTLNVVYPKKLKGILVGNLEQQLTQSWPNLMDPKNPTLNLNFWEKEWEKHGMCSDYGDNPVAYFSTAISLRNNVVSVLNLRRGRRYTVSGIATTVYVQVNGRPEINCVTRRAPQQIILGEVRLCYKKGDLTPQGIQNCTRLYSGDCSSEQDYITVL